MDFLRTVSNRDPFRLMFAPVLGMAAGFLVNRVRAGAVGTELLLEMAFGGTLLTLAVAGASALAAIERERARARAQHEQTMREAEARAAAQQHRVLVEAEAARCRSEMALRESLAETQNRLVALEGRSNSSELRNQLLKRALIELNGRVMPSLGDALADRVSAIEEQQRMMLEAQEKLLALEAAQEELNRSAVALSEQARKDAEEVKASLKLAISDSQRQRNMQAPQREESGRIIELEARLKRLAREIEKMSGRGAAVTEEGIASTVGQGGTKDQAKLGFFRALLDANQALRKQIRQAA
ncbi:hypothetical protein PLCT2_01289 [Planctomycetaceae bacterium]|nr:hypothetical protein PLCT2_01289 [Planctomycetaceae bacterium]